MSEINKNLSMYPIVVDNLGNDGDVTCMTASFEEYDCRRLDEKIGAKRRRDSILPLPTSTKRVKFDSSYKK